MAVIAPIALLAIKGILGIAVAGGLGLLGLNVAPVFAQKMSNWKYRALDAETVEHMEKVSNAAAQNPIETLINQSMEKRQASDQFRSAITMFRTEVSNFKTQIDGFAREYPEDVARFQSQLDAMNKLLKFREDRYKQLQVELDNFDSAIKRAQAMWKMSQAAQKMNKLAGMEIGDPFEKIKADSAINSVMTSMNKAFAEMETALLDNPELQKAKMSQIENTAEELPTKLLKSEKVSV
jgi:septal ring factor EnvC (AmiA/AmiB activator)